MTNRAKIEPESRLQSAVVTALQLFRFFPLMVPNGEVRDLSPQRYMRLTAQGFRRGAPDLLVFDLDNPQKAPLHLELKTPKGKQSDAQKKWEEFCTSKQWTYRLARTVEEAVLVSTNWRKENEK